jgi:hypothetical protein
MRLKRFILCSLATATFVSVATTIELPVTFSKRCCADSSKELPDLPSSGGGGADVIPVTYEQVRPWAKEIREAVLKHRMPPWHSDPHYGTFRNDRSLSPAEIDTLVAWVNWGAPQGDQKDLPPPVHFEEMAYRKAGRRDQHG